MSSSRQQFHPTELCECGCGLPAPVAPNTRTERGWLKGQVLKRRHGHWRRTPLPDRFWRRVTKRGDDECWSYRGYFHRGYGLMSTGPRETKYAHRLAYELAVGPIPDGLELDHLCRNTTCVNPAHLEPVTKAENLRRQRVASTERKSA